LIENQGSAIRCVKIPIFLPYIWTYLDAMFCFLAHNVVFIYNDSMTENERFALVRKTLKLTQREFAEKISVATGFIACMEIGERKVNPRIMKLVSSIFNVNLQWLETGEGEMFYTDTESEIEEIISHYRRLNPFFKKFIMRQLRDLIEYK